MPDRRTLGKYQIDEVLGEGGMGIVYKGYDRQIDRPVAIKTVRKSLLEGSRGQELLDRFHKEAVAVGRLTHQNIIAIYDYDQDPQTGSPYFVMEYVQGREVRDYYKPDQPLAYELAVSIALQMLSALGYAHAHGVIHRDIKPANIILLDDHQVKIADFGIARIMDPELTQADDTGNSHDLTQTGMVLGSPRYMSPEQCLGHPLDSRSDLYSTALVLYELLTGSKAFDGPLPGAVFDRVQKQVPAPDRSADPRARNLFTRVLRKALERNPDERYQTAEAFAEALQDCIRRPARAAGHNWLRAAAASSGILLAIAVALLFIRDIDNDATALPTAETAVEASALNSEEQQKVERLLQVARMHLLVGRLVTPTGSNAHYAFEQVQKIDPQNQTAASGIQDISQRLQQKARKMIDEGQTFQARELVTEGLKYYPDHQPLLQLAQQLGPRE